jgi:hypothetical protein
MPTTLIETRIRFAAFLVGLGLLLQILSLLWIHPLAFMAFALVACPLVGIGILLYLFTLVSHATPPTSKSTD